MDKEKNDPPKDKDAKATKNQKTGSKRKAEDIGWRANAKRLRKMQVGDELIRTVEIALGNLANNDLFQSTTPGELEKHVQSINAFVNDADLLKMAQSNPEHIEAAMDLRDRLRPAREQCTLSQQVVEGMKQGIDAHTLAKHVEAAQGKGVKFGSIVHAKIVEATLQDFYEAKDVASIREHLETAEASVNGLPTVSSMEADVKDKIVNERLHHWFNDILWDKAKASEFWYMTEELSKPSIKGNCRAVGHLSFLS